MVGRTRSSKWFATWLLARGKVLASKNVIHSDLKPANVFLKTDITTSKRGFKYRAISSVRIGDFGGSVIVPQASAWKKFFSSSNPEKKCVAACVKSEKWASPELLHDGQLCNPTSSNDVWALGIMMSQMITTIAQISNCDRSEMCEI